MGCPSTEKNQQKTKKHAEALILYAQSLYKPEFQELKYNHPRKMELSGQADKQQKKQETE
ncbi:hypothetical protein KJ959_00685 [bacterium]|nr:hypothetical protein [bacterium]